MSNATVANGTGAADNHVLSPLLDGLLPFLGGASSPLVRLLMILNQQLGASLGIDPSALVAGFVFAWAFSRLWSHLSTATEIFVRRHLTSSVDVESNDQIHRHIMHWLAAQPKFKKSRNLTAQTIYNSRYEDDESKAESLSVSKTGEEGDDNLYLNFSHDSLKQAPRYVPAIGSHSFWHNGRYFTLRRNRVTVFSDRTVESIRDKDIITIQVVGRSIGPINDLLGHIKQFWYRNRKSQTTVMRPSPFSKNTDYGHWMGFNSRPIRPMRTVILEQAQKKLVLADMNEYLHPKTKTWYANRGIPLRRGYLFYGPPGTGKTSFSFALAGLFGLDIYVLSLQDPSLTEEKLGNYFSALPRRCFVLLEDIDSAGLSRAQDESEKKSSTKSKAVADDKDDEDGDNDADSEDKDAEKASTKEKEVKKGITLSGLLNAIDGVASQEGRILIMTTNKPESLDDALIRPGRVDLQVGFSKMTRSQTAELYLRMFDSDDFQQPLSQSSSSQSPATPNTEAKSVSSEKPEKPKLVVDTVKTANSDGSETGTLTPPKTPIATGTPPSPKVDERCTNEVLESMVDDLALITPGQLRALAKEFAARIPDDLFSPAEVQGFLIKRKKTPVKAVLEVDAWAEALAQNKEKHVKMLKVQ